MSERMALMQELKGKISTHNCPECGGPAYCALEAGKSANLCWCMDVTATSAMASELGTECLCRRCLTTTASA